MKTKEEIVKNWLPRYTKRKLEDHICPYACFLGLSEYDSYPAIYRFA